jgi:hypothetical protein
MSASSTIEWTDATWNPVRGCTKISPGCKHCYAETFAERFRGVPGHPYEQGFEPRLVPEKLAEPLRWGTSKTIFVNSMSDLFHEDVPDWYIAQVVRVMQLANWHTYQAPSGQKDCVNFSGQNSLSSRIPGISGGGQASRTRDSACRGSTICTMLRPRFDSSRSSRCSKI